MSTADTFFVKIQFLKYFAKSHHHSAKYQCPDFDRLSARSLAVSFGMVERSVWHASTIPAVKHLQQDPFSVGHAALVIPLPSLRVFNTIRHSTSVGLRPNVLARSNGICQVEQ
jgi:hypothetical protein